jgi:hypothetical protein
MPTACSCWSPRARIASELGVDPSLRPAHPDATAACGVPMLGMCPTATNYRGEGQMLASADVWRYLLPHSTLSRRSAPRRTSICCPGWARQHQPALCFRCRWSFVCFG